MLSFYDPARIKRGRVRCCRRRGATVIDTSWNRSVSGLPYRPQRQ